MSLKGKIFAITGTLSTTRPEVVKWISERGGIVSPSVTKKVTHLIVSDPSITTDKISAARKNGTTIISEADLRALDSAPAPTSSETTETPTAAPQRAPKKAVVAKKLVQTTLVNPKTAHLKLTGMTVALTGKLSKSKEEFAAIIAANGGTYSATVTKKVTHLIARESDAASDKLDKARKNGITIVDESFLAGLAGTVATIGKTQASDESGEPAAPPPAVLLANKYEPGKINPVGWWVSEKLDGVRSYWNGKRFLSRVGHEFYPPQWYIDAMPKDHCLDGELFMGRKMFQQTVSIVKSHEGSERWRDVTFMVFDIPSSGDQPFEKRMELLNQVCAGIPQVRVVEQTKFTEANSMPDLLKAVEALGGEGLMLRQPGSKYIGKRSSTLLKVKSFTDDEAKVIGYATEGRGRLKGTTGSLQVVNRAGVKFCVGSGLTDEDRRNPPPIGSIITFKFQELSNSGTPRFPTYVGMAIDKDFP